jgi:hypothetical protein
MWPFSRKEFSSTESEPNGLETCPHGSGDKKQVATQRLFALHTPLHHDLQSMFLMMVLLIRICRNSTHLSSRITTGIWWQYDPQLTCFGKYPELEPVPRGFHFEFLFPAAGNGVGNAELLEVGRC